MPPLPLHPIMSDTPAAVPMAHGALNLGFHSPLCPCPPLVLGREADGSLGGTGSKQELFGLSPLLSSFCAPVGCAGNFLSVSWGRFPPYSSIIYVVVKLLYGEVLSVGSCMSTSTAGRVHFQMAAAEGGSTCAITQWMMELEIGQMLTCVPYSYWWLEDIAPVVLHDFFFSFFSLVFFLAISTSSSSYHLMSPGYSFWTVFGFCFLYEC